MKIKYLLKSSLILENKLMTKFFVKERFYERFFNIADMLQLHLCRNKNQSFNAITKLLTILFWFAVLYEDYACGRFLFYRKVLAL